MFDCLIATTNLASWGGHGLTTIDTTTLVLITTTVITTAIMIATAVCVMVIRRAVRRHIRPTHSAEYWQMLSRACEAKWIEEHRIDG